MEKKKYSNGMAWEDATKVMINDKAKTIKTVIEWKEETYKAVIEKMLSDNRLWAWN